LLFDNIRNGKPYLEKGQRTDPSVLHESRLPRK
jgi:hypothetical protein